MADEAPKGILFAGSVMADVIAPAKHCCQQC